jgi:hypothetical protein
MLLNTSRDYNSPISPFPIPLTACLHRRSPAGSEPAPRCMKSFSRKRIRLTWNGRIFTDFPIRVNPRHPRNPCSTAASLFVDAPSRGVTLGAFICGSFFAGALDINYCEFIKVWASPKSSPQSHHIPPISSSKHGTLLSERRLIAARKTKYAFLQLFNSKTDKTGDNENI